VEPIIEAPAGSRERVSGLVSILMVNWNDLRYLGGCLGSIRKQISVPHEVILFDNKSEDESVSFVRREFPEVKVVRNDENLGFIRGTNKASTFARGEFYFLLNPDTVLRTDIGPAVKLLQADRSIGVVGAKMYGGNGELIARGGSYPFLLRLALIKSLFWRPYRGSWGPKEFGAKRVDWVSGSWLLTRASAWDSVGGLDAHLFLYCDEMHYCRSIKELGLKTVLMPSLAYTHFRGYSLKRLPYLYAGFRRFHIKFSGKRYQRFADIVMKFGLHIRLAVYGVLALLLRNSKYKDRQYSMQRVLNLWDQMNKPGYKLD
jgi:GT2 family glycosyltransferase